MRKEISIEEWSEWQDSLYFRTMMDSLREELVKMLNDVLCAEDRDAAANRVLGMDDAIRHIVSLKGE